MDDETRTLEDMDEPCPEDICDGSGLVEDENGKMKTCPHVLPEDEYDPDA